MNSQPSDRAGAHVTAVPAGGKDGYAAEIDMWNPMKPRRRRYFVYACIVLINLVNLISYALISSQAHTTAKYDAVNYIAMSQDTFAQVLRPYAFRLMTPWLVHNLQRIPGLPLDYAWLLVTCTATCLTLILFLKLLLDHLRLSLFTSTVCTVMLACTYWYALAWYGNFWVIDPMDHLLYLLAIYLAVRRRPLLFALVVVFGTVNKESMLYLTPLYALLAWARVGTWRTREVLHGALVVVAGTAFYLAFQAWAQAMIGGNEGYSSFSWDTIRHVLNVRKGVEQQAIFSAFHFLWLIFCYGAYRLYRRSGVRHELIVISAVLLAGSLFSRLFATDTERMYVMMAPAVLSVCAVVLNAFQSEPERLWTGVLAFLYLAINFTWIPAQWAVAANLAALVIFAWMIQQRHRVDSTWAAQLATRPPDPTIRTATADRNR